MYVQRSRLLRILSPHSFSVYLATCWQKYPISFTANFTEKVGACAFSVYQALSPPLKGPGDEASDCPAGKLRTHCAIACNEHSRGYSRSSFMTACMLYIILQVLRQLRRGFCTIVLHIDRFSIPSIYCQHTSYLEILSRSLPGVVLVGTLNGSGLQLILSRSIFEAFVK